ncbi:MAG: hypothetical protein K6F62_00225 [Schwartzia sp.]|nr:hypothetical protein [Schwartzia sp. (in: firmicutes)]
MRACAREILAHDLDDLDALALLAQASYYLGEEDAAERIVQRVSSSDPYNWRILLTAAELAVGNFELRAAIPLLQRLWRLGEVAEGDIPQYKLTLLERAGRLLTDTCYLLGRAKEAAEVCMDVSALVKDPAGKADLYSKALFLTNYQTQDKHHLALREGYNAFFGIRVKFPHTRPEGVPDRKLRIGYLSPDFREHAVANFLTPFLRDYSKLDFSVFCYTIGNKDHVSKRFRRYAAAWRDVTGLTPKETAQKIYQDRIDILVDFSGHSQGSCLPVLTYRPAPIQMIAIGDINTSGLHEADYFLSDYICQPPDEGTVGFTEKIARVPYCHLCYSPEIVHELPPPAEEPPAKRNGYVTFGSFNNFAKVSRETLLLWRGVLEAVPDSRLIIKGKIASIPDGIEEAKSRLRDIGINPGRVDFRPYSPDYLEQYRDVDIALDTTPYNGGLTTCEALIMGVPVITRKGNTHGSRYGATILENAGLPELVAKNDGDYVRKAVQIANSMEILEKFHSGLRNVVKKSRLMDGIPYMKDIEDLYRHLWKDYCTFS